jgi:hypothetical protein
MKAFQPDLLRYRKDNEKFKIKKTLAREEYFERLKLCVIDGKQNEIVWL